MEENINSTPAVETPAPQFSEQQLQQMPIDSLKAMVDGTAQPPAPEPQQTPEPYTMSTTPEGVEIRLSTGEVFKGESVDAVLPKILKSKIDTTVWARQMHKQYEEFRRNPEQPVAMPEDPNAAAIQAQLAEEAAQAQAVQQAEMQQYLQSQVLTPEVRQQLVAEAFGVQPDQLQGAFQQIQSVYAENAINRAYLEFADACKDFVPTQRNAALILEQIPEGYLPSAADLQMIWARAVYSGQAERFPQQPAQRPVPPPPVMPSGIQSGMGSADPWKMDLRELRKQVIG